MLKGLNLNQIFEKLAADKKKLVGFICISLLVIYVDYSFILTPQLSARRNLRVKLKAVRLDLDNFFKGSQRIKNLSAKKDTSKGAFPIQTFVSGGQVPLILQHISNLANNYDIKILQIKPSRSKEGTKQASFPEAKDFAEFIITMDVVCDYNHLTKFLDSLEKGNIFVSIEGLKIIPQEGDILKQKANLGLRTYVRR